MGLTPGARLGAYEIVGLIGAGGMGEVYRAVDTRLNRPVAIKVLPPSLAADPQLCERFEREARAISALQHPHICALFDVGEAIVATSGEAGRAADHGTVRFLVLELLDGETLATRISRAGAIAPAGALKIAIEVCDALDAAHRAGIVHRDLKPANVMLTRSGAKLLDFGLAKAAAPTVVSSGVSMLPTTPPNVTMQGAILGTFQYMAPEQVEGCEADARSDIFSFGTVLFEMLTGRTAFSGKTHGMLLGAILKDHPPPVSSVEPAVSKLLDRIVAICLAKDPDDRYQSARDLGRDLRWAAAGPDLVAQRAAPRHGVARRVWIGVSLALLALTAGVIALTSRTSPAAPPVIHFEIPPPDGTLTFATPPGGGTGVAAQAAVSPDGRAVVFVAFSKEGFQLWLRPLDASEARPLAGTADATFPFWSPDGRHVGFFARGRLYKVAVGGGPPIALCEAASGRGGTWNRENVIVFSPNTNQGLMRVAATGGVPTPATSLDQEYGETNHRFPQFLPDGRHFLFVATVGTCCPAAKPARIQIGSLDSGEVTTVLQVESAGVYAAGHLLYNRDGALMAQPFDATRGTLGGDPFLVANPIASEGSRYASVSASENGVLVYARGIARPELQLSWMDRQGRVLGTVGEPADYQSLSLSPDEQRIAVAMNSGIGGNRDVYLLDLRQTNPVRFTFDPGPDASPVWSPDGTRVLFQGNRNGTTGLRLKRVDQVSVEEELASRAAGQGAITPNSWSRDGRYVLFTKTLGTAGSTDIWVLPMDAGDMPTALVDGPSGEGSAVFSPDGKWFAYQSNESGTTEIYVQPFPTTGAKYQVSRNGGFEPDWSHDGRELYFVAPDGQFMTAAVDTSRQFARGDPAALFSANMFTVSGATGRHYAVSRDGRFLVSALQQRSSATPLTVVVNWLPRH